MNKRDLEEYHALGKALATAKLLAEQARHQQERAEFVARELEQRVALLESRGDVEEDDA
jgi:hypothetical protein